MEIAFTGGAYKGRFTAIDGQECINWYVEKEGPDAKARQPLLPTPGLHYEMSLPGSGPVRALYATSTDRLFAVRGNMLYEIFPDNPNTLSYGPLLTSNGQLSIADNGNVDSTGRGLYIVDGQYHYMFNLSSNTFSQVTVSDIPASTKVLFIDSFFIINEKNTGQVYNSNNYDGKTWNLGNYATKEGYPDELLTMATVHNELWLFGRKTIEVWGDNGGDSFPFQRIPGTLIQNGTIAPESVAVLGNTVFWLGSGLEGYGQVYAATGYQPQKISVPAIDYQLEQMDTLEDAVAYCYSQEGHNFYVVSFPTGNKTFCYDLTTGEWHERSYLDPATGKMERHRSNYSAFAYNKTWVSDYSTGDIYSLSMDEQLDRGTDLIRRVRTTQHQQADRKRLFYSSLEIDIQRGVGAANGQGQSPTALLYISDDGGSTWTGGTEGNLGGMGQYQQRLRWTRLGNSRDRMFRLVITDPVSTALLGARADVTVGA